MTVQDDINDATATVVALLRCNLDHDNATGGQIVAELDRRRLISVIGVLVAMLAEEIESACNCCVGFTATEYVECIGLEAAKAKET
jgi:hypothetical protein